MIQVRDLSISYGIEPVLQGIDLHIHPAEWVLVTGPSGCGKSTLVKAISGIIPQAIPAQMSGSITVAGLNTRDHSLADIAQKVGMVFQNPGSQLFHLRVEDEIAFGPRNLGLDEEQVRERVEWALTATGLSNLRERKPMQLSGGQKQCVAIASLLAMRPQVLVLDEPTASLDLLNTYQVMETLTQLRDHYGITIVMVEHRLAAASQRVDRVLLMEDYQIIDDGPPQKVLDHRERRDALGLRRPADLPMSPWIQLIQPNGSHATDQKPVLELSGVAAGFECRDVIRDIDLQIYPGDFVALVGSNGSGKSTLALVMAGLLKPTHGRVSLDGAAARPQPGLDVTLLFQDAADQLFTDCVDEEVAFGPQNYDCFHTDQHLQILAQADLLGLRYRRVTALSVGQQQRTALAACLALHPRIVILDEPTLGQDWGHLQQLMDFLSQLNRQGTAVILISHDYKLVHHYARRIFLLEDGQIKTNGHIKSIRPGETHEI
ncbi:MAG: ABC transporter ATP-binding protein [Anaerolineales bacterium]|jgi:energy-coupling factor transport system ATP-binding protein